LTSVDRSAAYGAGSRRWFCTPEEAEVAGWRRALSAEAFHYQFKHTNRYEEVSKRIRLGKAIEGRDEKGIKKTVCAFLKILHPNGAPTNEEFEDYVAYATECRRRVKEQMNKRKPDEEFALINLSYFKASGDEVVVFCPESKDAAATQHPARRRLSEVERKPKEGTDTAIFAQVPAKPDLESLGDLE
jgi:ATP-dependent Lon protease